MFLIPITVFAVLAASLAPALRGAAENGLDQVPKVGQGEYCPPRLEHAV